MQSLDLRGEICPVPLMKTLNLLDSLSRGERLRVMVDVPCARNNVPKHLLDRGYRVDMKEVDGYLEIVVTV